MTLPSTQTHDLHRALLRPMVIHTLRAAGFHSTKPSVLDTIVNLAERYLVLLADTTASHATNSHGNASRATVADARAALAECAALGPAESAAEEGWRERFRDPIDVALPPAGRGTAADREARTSALRQAEKRKREQEDVSRDIGTFVGWVEGPKYAEIKRVAGNGPAEAGVGGSVVRTDDFLTLLKKRMAGKGADVDARWVGTVLGQPAEEKVVVVEGGPVGRVRDWRPKGVQRESKEEKIPESDTKDVQMVNGFDGVEDDDDDDEDDMPLASVRRAAVT